MGQMNVVVEAGVRMIVEMNRIMVDDAGTNVSTSVALDNANPITVTEVCC